MKTIIFILAVFISFNVNAAVSWTVQADGVLANSSGSVAIKIGGIPSSPNPAGSTWESCKHNLVYFHRSADGTRVDDLALNRMLSVASAAAALKHGVRLAIERDDKGYCLTQQIYDLGK